MSLHADSVSLSYFDGDQTVYAVKSLSLSLPAHGFFGVMGPSGSGKSSLLYLLSGLKQPTQGEVIYAGRSLSSMTEKERVRLRREKFGFVFQQPYLLNYLTARENVLLAAPTGQSYTPREVDELLDSLQISHLADRYPAHLSGGERQRIIVARAMINRPEAIFADEPTASLDHANGLAVIALLRSYRDRGSVLIVTHDPLMVEGADAIYHMIDGRLERVELPDRQTGTPVRQESSPSGARKAEDAV